MGLRLVKVLLRTAGWRKVLIWKVFHTVEGVGCKATGLFLISPFSLVFNTNRYFFSVKPHMHVCFLLRKISPVRFHQIEFAGVAWWGWCGVGRVAWRYRLSVNGP